MYHSYEHAELMAEHLTKSLVELPKVALLYRESLNLSIVERVGSRDEKVGILRPGLSNFD